MSLAHMAQDNWLVIIQYVLYELSHVLNELYVLKS